MDSESYKKRRKEAFWYDIPMMPHSETPDGRIVYAINNAGKNAASELDKIQRNQSALSNKQEVFRNEINSGLTNAFQANQVSSADWNRIENIERRNEIIGDNLSRYFTDSHQQMNEFAQTTQQGLKDTTHAIDKMNESMFFQTDKLMGGIGQISDVMNESAKQTADEIRNLKGPLLADGSLGKYFKERKGYQALLTAYSQNILNDDTSNRVEKVFQTVFDKAYRPNDVTKKVESKVKEMVAEPRYVGLINDKEINSALYAFRYIMDSCKRPDTIYKQMQVLENANRYLQLPELTKLINGTKRQITEYSRLKRIPLRTDVLVDLANENALAPKISHSVKEHYRGARKEGTLVDMNYNLMEANVQRDEQNLKLNQIVGNLGSTNEILKQNYELDEKRNELLGIHAQLQYSGNVLSQEQLKVLKANNVIQGQDLELSKTRNDILGRCEAIQVDQRKLLELNNQISYEQFLQQKESNAHLINIENFTHELVNVASDGFMAVSENLQEIAEVCGLGFNQISESLDVLGMQLANEMRYNTDRVVSELSQTNILLKELVGLTRDSLDNLALQRYKQGLRAIEQQEYQDALKCFKEGVEQNPTDARNHFGIGLTYELTFDWENATAHYIKAIKYDDDDSFSNVAWHKLMGLYRSMGKLDSAIECVDRLLAQNADGRLWLEKAEMFALSYQYDEALSTLKQAIRSDENALKWIKGNAAFYNLNILELYTDIAKENTLQTLGNRYYLFYELLNFRAFDEALNYLLKAIMNHIYFKHLTEPFWKHPFYHHIQQRVEFEVGKKLDGGYTLSSQKYAATVLFYFMKLDPKLVASSLEMEINNDVRFLRNELFEIILELRKLHPDWKALIAYVETIICNSKMNWMIKYTV